MMNGQLEHNSFRETAFQGGFFLRLVNPARQTWQRPAAGGKGGQKKDMEVENRRNKIKDLNYIYIYASVFFVEILNY